MTQTSPVLSLQHVILYYRLIRLAQDQLFTANSASATSDPKSDRVIPDVLEFLFLQDGPAAAILLLEVKLNLEMVIETVAAPPGSENEPWYP